MNPFRFQARKIVHNARKKKKQGPGFFERGNGKSVHVEIRQRRKMIWGGGGGVAKGYEMLFGYKRKHLGKGGGPGLG